MDIAILGSELFERRTVLRFPFRFGVAVFSEAPHVIMRLRIRHGGAEYSGLAADGLPPRWFSKEHEQTPDEDIAQLRRSIAQARGAARGASGTPFAIWRELYRQQMHWGERSGEPALVAQYGCSMVERAMIDACCRASGSSFARLLRAPADGVGLGLELGAVHGELAGRSVAELLAQEPLRQITARHVVGHGDYLADAAIPDGERLADGLPQSLEASIARYGLRHFKLKIGGDVAHDLERLQACAAQIGAQCADDYRFTLDANEGFSEIAPLIELWQRMQDDERLRAVCSHCWFIEQPFHRDLALSDAVAPALRGWNDRPPIIIDESDAELGSCPRALELGYDGTSHKNCKGIFKGIANRCLINARNDERGADARELIMSGEDLCNIGPIALPQDLAVQATLGNASVERNGHHYIAGLSPFPQDLQETLLSAHGDLYERSERGCAQLRITDGCIDVGSVVDNGFGVVPELDPAAICAGDPVATSD